MSTLDVRNDSKVDTILFGDDGERLEDASLFGTTVVNFVVGEKKNEEVVMTLCASELRSLQRAVLKALELWVEPNEDKEEGDGY